MQRGERRDEKHDKQRGGRISAQSGRGQGGRSSSNSQQSRSCSHAVVYQIPLGSRVHYNSITICVINVTRV